MLATSVWTQFRLMARRKSAMITFYVVLAFVLVNYLTNVVTYQGSEILEMVHPMQLLLLSDESGAYSLLFIQLYPLLVVLPAGFSFALDRDVDETVFYLTRVGSKDYYRGKLIAAFSITFLVLTLPLLLEIVLNCLSFPLDATGNLDNWSVYDENYIADVQTYLWSGLFLHPPYLYAALGTLLFGLVPGVLGVFTVALSTFPIRYKIYLFLPAWILLYGVGLLGQLLPFVTVDTGYTIYLQLYDAGPKSEVGYLLLVGILALFSVGTLLWRSREDWLK